ncbi:SurA N-terminal domain-containing protein [Prauserella cavernicola]|uniref:SurA N-terminal domain-containing protein n=1 Tax=Prauserella cavernicola TaxID=2800127 RepID=A0A934V2E3_9PSEU|nr:SurA N-terminal domain-containing protein [Prauserella cavernicola]MBK1785561.1 SurA N-terminal domain-containing protein [Prauserella cavernicola]
MIRIIRRPVTLLATVAAGLVLAGCGSGPSQVGSAAIIGDRTIPLEEVQQEVRWMLDNVPEAEQAKEQGKFDLQAREIVRSRVIHELTNIAAEREGLRADPAEIDALIEGSGGADAVAKGVGVAPERVRQLASDQVVLQQLAQRYVDRVSVRLVGTSIITESPGSTAKDQALEIGRDIAADPDNVEQIVQESGNQLIDSELPMAQTLQNQPEIASSAVFGASEGSVLVIQPSQEQAEWLVALVEERNVTAGNGQASTSQADPQYLYFAGLRLLQPIADELGVRLNPRYGVWDATALSPAASEDELAGYQLQSRTVQP